MRNLILGVCTWQILIALSSQLAIESSKDDATVSDAPTFESPEVYVDHIINPEEAELEEPLISSLPLGEFENVREKRHTYKILESPGLHSRFRKVQDEDVLKINPHKRRYRRSTKAKSELHSDEVEDSDDTSAGKKSEGSDFSFESIVPQAQKQTMNPAYYRSDDSRLMDKWVKAPYGDFQARVHKEEDDSQSEQSSNVGIKTRTPRVNFITQQGQSGSNGGGGGNKDEIPDGPEARERERERERERDRDRDQQNSNNNNNNNNNNGNKQSNNDDGYRKPVDRYSGDRYNNNYQPSYYNKYDTYDRPQHSQYPPNPYNSYYNRDYPPAAPAYPPYYEKYDPYFDRYYERNGIAPPPGMSRMTPPLGPSSSFYYRHNYNEYDDYIPRSIPNYYYSDKRFEMPMEPRAPSVDPHRQYLVNNEVYNRPSRIVYYANLPDIVRTPNNYRSGTARYADPMYSSNYNYYNNYDRDEYKTRTAKAITYRDLPPSTTTMRVSSMPVDAHSVRERTFYG